MGVRYSNESKMKDRTQKLFFLCTGILSLTIGIIGIFVPLLPTTCFVLLAAYCFSKSSDKLYQRLIKHPRFGLTILSWQKYRVIQVPIKCWASTMISVSALIIWFQPYTLILKATVSVFLLLLVLFIWSCPHKYPEENKQN